MCLPCLIIIKSCQFDYRINKPSAHSRCVVCVSCIVQWSWGTTCAKDHRLFLTLKITHKSTKSENPITWYEARRAPFWVRWSLISASNFYPGLPTKEKLHCHAGATSKHYRGLLDHGLGRRHVLYRNVSQDVWEAWGRFWEVNTL